MELWYKELKDNANTDIKLFLVGNKIDLNDFQVDKEDIKKIKEELEIDLSFEVSAKSGENVEKLFVEASKILYTEYFNLNKNKKKKQENKKIVLETIQKEAESKKRNGCSC